MGFYWYREITVTKLEFFLFLTKLFLHVFFNNAKAISNKYTHPRTFSRDLRLFI